MSCSLKVFIVLALPILAQSIDVDRLVRSFQTIAMKPRHLPRQLIAQADQNPYLVAANLLDTECSYDGADCRVNPYIYVADAAPSPETDIGKLVAIAAGKSYVCASYKTAKECVADTANNCEVQKIPITSNDTIVEICDVQSGELGRLILMFGLCPKSPADQLLTCLGVSDELKSGNTDVDTLLADMTKPTSSCSSRDGITCESYQGFCIPVDLQKKYNYKSNSGFDALERDITNPNSTFWGCCNGNKLLAQERTCQAATSRLACLAATQCSWTDIDMSTDLMTTGVCSISNAAFSDMVADVNSTFGNYVKTVSTRCRAISSSSVCFNSPKIMSPSLTKAKALTQLQFTPGGGGAECKSNSAAQHKPLELVAVWLAMIMVAVFA